MNEPRDLVQRFEKNPQLPKGDSEILSVYGVESCPFASDDILCSRHVLASSFGPAYTAIWHREPDGDWRFYQDVPPRQGCPRFFGIALAGVIVLPIETQRDGPRRLRIVAPGRIEWQFDLNSTLATRAMNLIGSVMPNPLWKNPTVLAAMAPVAGIVLGVGKLRMTGRAPNGQRFIANPLLTWTVPSAKVTIDGRNLGAVVPCGSSPRWPVFGYRAPGRSRSVARFSTPSTRRFILQQQVEPSLQHLVHQQSLLPHSNCVVPAAAAIRWSTKIQENIRR
jgi:hypothetical protein